MKLLLAITALFEGGTGLALIIMPTSISSLLLGTTFTNSSVNLIFRFVGITLIVFAIACWLARQNPHSPVIMVKVMLGYNLFSITFLIYLAVAEKMYGVGLWPAVLIHLVLLFWCLSVLRKRVQKLI